MPILPTWQEMQTRYDESFAGWLEAGGESAASAVESVERPSFLESFAVPVVEIPPPSVEKLEVPSNLLEFNKLFPDDDSRARYLFRVASRNGKQTVIFTDGWGSYGGLQALGFHHVPILQTKRGASTGQWLPLVHLIISNLKRWLMGTHKGAVLPKHLQAYLNEFTFRFNRRFWRGPAFLRALGFVVNAEKWPEYETLYHAGEEGGWRHPNPDVESAVRAALREAMASLDVDKETWLVENQEAVWRIIASVLKGC